VGNKRTQGGGFSENLGFSPSIYLKEYYVLLFTFMFLLLERQRGNPGKLPKRNDLQQIGKHWIKNYCFFNLDFQMSKPSNTGIIYRHDGLTKGNILSL
jgi:hypothetical protein